MTRDDAPQAHPIPRASVATSRRFRLGSARIVVPLIAALAITACNLGGAAYPDREITMIVPFSEGGPTDTVTRLIGDPMAAELEAEIVVQNVEGAGGTVAAEQVANAEADGYTVLMHHIGMSTAPTLYPNLGYDPLEGTAPAMDDLLGNQVDFMCDQTTNTTENILANEVKAYAVTTPERIEA